MRILIRKNLMMWIILLLFLATGVGFFLPVSGSGWSGFIGKGVLFLFVVFGFYTFLVVPSGKRFLLKESDIKEQESPVVETADEDYCREEWEGFGEAFHLYYQEFLAVVRSAVVATCAGLYLQKGHDGLEFQGGENEDGHIDRRILINEDDLVGQVAKQKTPLREGNLPIGTNLAGIGGLEIRSFLGVPLIWEKEVVGVLAVGSEATNSFGQEDLEFLVQWGGLITRVMAICHRGLRWEMNQTVYRVHLELGRIIQKVEDEESAVYCFVQHIRRLFHFDRFTLCVKEKDEGSIRHIYGQVDGMDRGLRFPLDGGLNGWIIKRNAPLLISDMEEGDYIRPRYFRDEDPKHGLHSYLGIPLGRGEEAWACFSLESRGIDQYGEKAKEALIALAVHLEYTLERIYLIKQLRELGQDRRSSDSAGIQID